mgnify:CR=1 FL=1
MTRLGEACKVKSKKVRRVETVAIGLAPAVYQNNRGEEDGDDLVAVFCAVAKCFPHLKSLEVCAESEEEDDRRDDEKETPPAAVPVQILTALLHPKKGRKKLEDLTLQRGSLSRG